MNDKLQPLIIHTTVLIGLLLRYIDTCVAGISFLALVKINIGRRIPPFNI